MPQNFSSREASQDFTSGIENLHFHCARERHTGWTEAFLPKTRAQKHAEDCLSEQDVYHAVFFLGSPFSFKRQYPSLTQVIPVHSSYDRASLSYYP